MPLFPSIFFLFFKAYFSESAILTFLLCSFFTVLCSVKSLYVLASVLCCFHLTIMLFIQEFVQVKLWCVADPFLGISISYHVSCDT